MLTRQQETRNCDWDGSRKQQLLNQILAESLLEADWNLTPQGMTLDWEKRKSDF